ANCVNLEILPHAALESSDVLHNEEKKVLIMCEFKVDPAKCFHKTGNSLLDITSEDSQMHILIMADDDMAFKSLLELVQETALFFPGVYHKILLPCPECSQPGWYFDFQADCRGGKEPQVECVVLRTNNKRQLIGETRKEWDVLKERR
ncbi:hypothetical protein CYMTET_34492, partial [Cymbomonas tetramitiformis]